MEVYSLMGNMKGYHSLYNPDRQYDDHFALDGSPRAATWTPVPVYVFYSPDGERQVLSDFPSFKGDLPVFSRRAADVLQDMLQSNGELLPLVCDQAEYLLYNTTTLLDALDLERSNASVTSSGLVVHVREYVLRKEALQGATIFKLPQMTRHGTYVTDEFVRRVQSHGLTGFEFQRVWRS